MTYRIDIAGGPVPELRVQGIVDRAALAGLREAAARSGVARIVLIAGTEVEAPCVAELRALGEVVAESPFLARWLEQPSRSPR